MEPRCGRRSTTASKPAWYLPLSDSVNNRRAEPDAERDKVTTLDLDTPTTAWTKPSHSDTCERLEHDSILFTRTRTSAGKTSGQGRPPLSVLHSLTSRL